MLLLRAPRALRGPGAHTHVDRLTGKTDPPTRPESGADEVDGGR